MRDVAEFISWLPATTCAAELHVIKAVTGSDAVPVDNKAWPVSGFEFAHLVALVETYGLHEWLCLAATDRTWWRIVANWDRLVETLNASEPRWREGKRVTPGDTDDLLQALIDSPPNRGRILLDMDGPLADFDRRCFETCAANNWPVDVAPEDQTHRYMTGHVVDDGQRASLRALINQPGWFRNLPVTAGALEGVAALIESGHHVVVCSKPLDANPHCTAEKIEWLREHFPTLTDFVFTNDKRFANGGTLLDDALVHEQATESTWTPVAFSTPFNGPGTEWGRYPHWSWGDPVERLEW